MGPEDVAGSPRSRGGAPPSPAGAWGPRGAPAGARMGMCLWNDTRIAPHPWPPELWGWQFPSSRTLAGKCHLPGPAEPLPLPAPRSGGSSTCYVLSSHGPSTAQCPTYGRGNVHKHSESPRGGSTRSGPGASIPMCTWWVWCLLCPQRPRPARCLETQHLPLFSDNPSILHFPDYVQGLVPGAGLMTPPRCPSSDGAEGAVRRGAGGS